MRRAGSLFDIDQEPLFEPLALEAGAEGHPDWNDSCDEAQATLASTRDSKVDEPEQRLPVAGRRLRLLVAVAAIGVVGLVSTRLTRDAPPPSASPRTAHHSPEVVTAGATAQPSPPAQRARKARRSDERAHRATQHERTRRAQRAPRAPRTENRQRATATPAQPAVPVSTPAPVTALPPAQAPAPEPQGFTGEFF